MQTGRHPGIDRERARQEPLGLPAVAPLRADDAQHVQGIEIVRIPGEHLAAKLFGLSEIAGALGGDGLLDRGHQSSRARQVVRAAPIPL